MAIPISEPAPESSTLPAAARLMVAPAANAPAAMQVRVPASALSFTPTELSAA
jgi:hypothetical protein